VAFTGIQRFELAAARTVQLRRQRATATFVNPKTVDAHLDEGES
jgi:hypothetical protein